MTTARSHRLWGDVLLSANPTTVATVPAGETWILKTLVAYNSDTVSRDLSLYVTTYVRPVWGVRSRVVASAAASYDDLWIVFEAGDLVRFDPSALNKLYVTGYGAKLTA